MKQRKSNGEIYIHTHMYFSIRTGRMECEGRWISILKAMESFQQMKSFWIPRKRKRERAGEQKNQYYYVEIARFDWNSDEKMLCECVYIVYVLCT